MTQKVVIECTSDLSGAMNAEELRFGFDGKDYIIDLTEEEAKAFREAIAPYAASARRSPSVPRSRKRSYTSSGTNADAKQARRWAEETGMIQPNGRGRLPAEVWEAYRKERPTISSR